MAAESMAGAAILQHREGWISVTRAGVWRELRCPSQGHLVGTSGVHHKSISSIRSSTVCQEL